MPPLLGTKEAANWEHRVIGGRRRIVYLGSITSAELVYYRKYAIDVCINRGRTEVTLRGLRKVLDDCSKNS